MVFICLLLFEFLHTSNTHVYTLYYKVYILLFLTSRNLHGSLNCQYTPALVYLNVVKLLLALKHLILGMACFFPLVYLKLQGAWGSFLSSPTPTN